MQDIEDTKYGWSAEYKKFRWGEIFRIGPGRPWGPPSLPYNGYRVIPGVKRPGSGVNHPHLCSAEIKERVEHTCIPPLGLHGLK